MYPLLKFQTLLLSGITIFSSVGIAYAAPLVSNDLQRAQHSASLLAVDWPLLPKTRQLKKTPQGVVVYQFDNGPVDNRQPLLMVHGLLGEYWDGFRWKKVASFLNNDPVFKSRYKIFLVRYNTRVPLRDVVPAMGEAVKRLSQSTGNSNVTIIALSMGGNVVEQCLQDGGVSSVVDRVLTMGTPFHGSPLFSSDWMEYSMIRRYRLPIARVDSVLPYQLYFDRHRNLLKDLSWDNTDSLIPSVGKFRTYFPYKIDGQLSPNVTGNEVIVGINKQGVVDKSKFIVYGGYLQNDYVRNRQINPILSVVKAPAWFTGTTVPEHVGREHAVLRVLNKHIAQVRIGSEPKPRKTYAYGLNDGITPLTSSLYLPDQAMSLGAFASEGDVQSLKSHINVRKARVFGNIDHLTFIDGYRPRGTKAALTDQLSPDEKERSIFAWILEDLQSPATTAPGLLGAK